MGLGFVVGVGLARLLGPASYGVFVYATTLATLFMPLVSLGLERIVIRDLARASSERPKLLGAAGVLRLAGGATSSLLAIGAATALETGDRDVRLMVATIAAGNVFLAMDVIDWAFQADGRFRVPVLVRLVGFVLGAAAKLALAAAGAPLLWLAGATLAEVVVVGVLFAVCSRGLADAPMKTWRAPRAVRFGLLTASWPLMIAEIANWIFQRVDLVILNRVATEAEVGRYAVAARVAQVFYFLPVVFVQVLSPMVARAGDRAEMLAVTGRAMAALAWLGVGLAAALSVGAPWLVPLLFGASYAPATPLVMVLAWTNVFVFLGCGHTLYLIGADLQRLSPRLFSLTAVVSLALNLLLVPRWQAMGAAVASLLTCLITPVFGVALFRESRPLFELNLRAFAAPARWFRP